MSTKAIIIFLALLVVGIVFAITSWLFTTEDQVSSGPVIQIADSLGQQVTLPDPATIAIEQNDDAKLLADESGFRILYFPGDQSFLITILAEPFNSLRTQAENAFLSIEKISASQACRLTVAERLAHDIEPTMEQREFKLSFCN
jgi:ABC-type Fe3+-hydroxamate transport system substrate-binding protein